MEILYREKFVADVMFTTVNNFSIDVSWVERWVVETLLCYELCWLIIRFPTPEYLFYNSWNNQFRYVFFEYTLAT